MTDPLITHALAVWIPVAFLLLVFVHGELDRMIKLRWPFYVGAALWPITALVGFAWLGLGLLNLIRLRIFKGGVDVG